VDGEITDRVEVCSPETRRVAAPTWAGAVLSMYQPHEISRSALGFAGSIVVAVLLSILSRARKWEVPRWIFPVILGLGMAQLAVVQGLQFFDDGKLREELKQLNPDIVRDLSVQHADRRRLVTDANEIRMLFSELQQLKPIAAHHSHPTDLFEVRFTKDGGRYRYVIGRDSERPQEYWVKEAARYPFSGHEIGRIQSVSFGRFLESLLNSAQKE
jgi:hypothetical protein